MFFKLKQIISHEMFGREEYSPMIFNYHEPDVEVVLKVLLEDDGSGRQRNVICESTLEREPNATVLKTFRDFSDGLYTESKEAADFEAELKQRMKVDEISGYCLPYDMLPENFKEFGRNIRKELYSYSSRTYKALRWIQDLSGPVEPFTLTKLYWSYDGDTWNEVPGGAYIADIQLRPGISSSENLIKLVESTVQSGDAEPLAHELLREAENLNARFPRSALLIGVAAAETGVKHCIVHLQPETDWLIENAPSPNIRALLGDYIPKLLSELTGMTNVASPQETILKPLQKAIQMRNKVVHGGKSSVTVDNVREALGVVKDLLWLLDYYCGHDWALAHLSEDCKKEVGFVRDK